MTKSLLRIITVVTLLLGAPLSQAADSGTRTRSAETKAKGSRSSAKIDVNTADAATLETLPGVGPATAKAIIAARPFKSVDELESVAGIGAARMAELRDHVRVSRTNPSAGKKSDRAAAKSKADTAPKREKRAVTESSTSSTKPGRAFSGKVDVNTADAETLETLPGVGPVIAQAIVASRPFNSVEDLARVPGIGEARLAEMRDHVTVSRRTSQRSTSSSDRGLSPTGRVNINTATREELEALPEIGPVKAQAIIEARPFRSTEDIMRVKGIKEGTYEVIKDQITVR